jgi:hypothetical protein
MRREEAHAMKSSPLARMRALLAGLALAGVCALPAAADAHHSYAMFDMTRSVDLKGTIVQFKWTNPHAWLTLNVKNAAGQDVVWNIEMNSPNNLAGLGWTRSSLKPGDQVTITVHPLKDDKAGGSFMAVTLASGAQLKG